MRERRHKSAKRVLVPTHTVSVIALTLIVSDAVIDRTGRLLKVFSGNEWQPVDLLAEMGHANGSR